MAWPRGGRSKRLVRQRHTALCCMQARLLADANAAAAELGITTNAYKPAPSAQPEAAGSAGAAVGTGQGPGAAAGASAAAASAPGAKAEAKRGPVLTVVENTEAVQNLIVCTLCRWGRSYHIISSYHYNAPTPGIPPGALGLGLNQICRCSPALQLLPAGAAGPVAAVVQEPRLPRARRA